MKDTSYIYVITDGENFKIGVTKDDPERRLKQLQTGNPKKLEIVGLYKVPSDVVYQLEKAAHLKAQSTFPKFGEWFKGATKFHINILVDQVCQNFIIEDQSIL